MVLGGFHRSERAISPVIGVVLMVVLTVLLAGMISAGLFAMEDRLEDPDLPDEEGFDEPLADTDPPYDTFTTDTNALETATHTFAGEATSDDTDLPDDIDVDYDTEDGVDTEPLADDDITVQVHDDTGGVVQELDTEITDDDGDNDIDIDVDSDDEQMEEGQWLVVELDGVEHEEAGTYDQVDISAGDALNTEVTLEIEE